VNSEQGTHFFLITIQYTRTNGSFGITSANGAWTPDRKATRLDVFNAIRAELESQHPECRGGAVLAFNLQPNKL
jgi:hypothetical protein